jgi:hypothetical protein
LIAESEQKPHLPTTHYSLNNPKNDEAKEKKGQQKKQ